MQLSESRRPVFRGEDAVYHIVSRVSCGKRIFGDERETPIPNGRCFLFYAGDKAKVWYLV